MNMTLAWPSSNRKTGPIATLTVDKVTCPTSCPLLNGPCYADNGPLRLAWQNVRTPWETALGQIERLPMRTALRYGQAGDLPGEGDWIDGDMLDELIHACRRLDILAYTHKPVLGDSAVARHNRFFIAKAVKAGFLINLSADNPRHADWLADLDLAPVVTIVARAYHKRRDETISEWRNRIADLPTHTPAGRRLAICPATYANTTCERCRACMQPRNAIIAFPAHGARWRQVEQVTGVAARDVPIGQSWAFDDHRTMAEVIADEQVTAA